MENVRSVAPHLMINLKKLDRYCKLPAPQTAVHELAALTGDEDVSFAKVARIVQLDPGIAGALIKLSNSAFFAQRYQVKELVSAVRVLGLDLAIAAAMGAILSNQVGTLGATKSAYRQEWYEGILRAHVARGLANAINPKLAGQAYLIGLFLEVGRLGLLSSVRNYDVMLSAWGQAPERLLEVELETFDVTHKQIMARILHNWQLPEALSEPLLNDEVPSASPATSDDMLLRQIVHVLRSVSVCKSRGSGVTEPAINEFITSAFSLDEAQFDRVLTVAGSEVSSMRRTFGPTIPRGARIVADFADLQRELLDCRDSLKWLSDASILIVSDDEEQVQTMRAMLGELGAGVPKAAPVCEAVTVAESLHPSMILLQQLEAEEPTVATEGCRSVGLRTPISVHCTHRELGAALAARTDSTKQRCHDASSLWRRIHALRLQRYRQPVLL